jgi:hypothetical protein
LERRREFLWLCRACAAQPDVIRQAVADGYLVVLARPAEEPTPAIVPRVPVAADAAAGRPASAFDPPPALVDRLLVAARAQYALHQRMEARLGRVAAIAALGRYYVDLLEEDARDRLDAIGKAVALRTWRAYGVDDLDHGLMNHYYRLRTRELGRSVSPS